MKRLLNVLLITVAMLRLPASASGSVSGAYQPGDLETVVIEGGKATFFVATNMPGITVKGRSEALRGRVQIHRASDGVTLERIEAWLAVTTLATGVAVRDKHMREHVFTTPSGELPDLRFEGEKVACPGVLPGHEATCQVSGTLAIRGVARNFSIPLRIREDGAAPSFRVSGDATLRLSDYGIEQPSQFGVRTANEIEIHLELAEASVTAHIAPAQ